ncbi:hypothetical protein DFH06DRAFT_1128365 [Mycena polygramma]|nr:hypothetical protein DFH06DRAFT_1128365 [Mycena polygramma]
MAETWTEFLLPDKPIANSKSVPWDRPKNEVKGTSKTEQLVRGQSRGFIPIQQVLETEVESEDISKWYSLNRGSERSRPAMESPPEEHLEAGDPGYDWEEMAQDEIRTLRVKLARLQNQNSERSIYHNPLVFQSSAKQGWSPNPNFINWEDQSPF